MTFAVWCCGWVWRSEWIEEFRCEVYSDPDALLYSFEIQRSVGFEFV